MKHTIGSYIKFLFSGDATILFRKWIWEVPQNVVGFFVVMYFTIRGKVLYSEEAEGVMVIVTRGRWGAISLGHFIIGSSSISPVVGNQLFMHEFGHSIQSRSWGPFYLLVVGLPSLASVIFRSRQHHKSYVERSANKLAYRYFNNKYLLEYWDMRNYPITSRYTHIT